MIGKQKNGQYGNKGSMALHTWLIEKMRLIIWDINEGSVFLFCLRIFINAFFVGRALLPKCMIKKGAKGPHDLLVNIKYFLVFHAQIIAIIDCFYVILQLFAAVRFFVRYTTTLIGVCGPRCSTGQGWSALMLSYYMRYYVMLRYVMLCYSTLCFVTLYYIITSTLFLTLTPTLLFFL